MIRIQFQCHTDDPGHTAKEEECHTDDPGHTAKEQQRGLLLAASPHAMQAEPAHREHAPRLFILISQMVSWRMLAASPHALQAEPAHREHAP